MNVFISYRRGRNDGPNAGRIYDYLSGLGYAVFYDRSEEANPTGRQYPGTLEERIKDSRVIVAVIGHSWIDSIEHRLCRDENDPVRWELRYANPESGRLLIPIYFEVTPGNLPEKLPDDIDFVRTTATHYLWNEFEEREKAALAEKLDAVLPNVARWPRAARDLPRLELLCDRTRAVDGFESALRRGPDSARPGKWILFGHENQGHAALFERLQQFTLCERVNLKRYGTPLVIDLSLHDYGPDEHGGCSLEEMRAQVTKVVMAPFSKGSVPTCKEVYGHLCAENIRLAFLYSVVYPSDVSQVRWWLERFEKIHYEWPDAEADKTQLVMALSIAYKAPKRRFGIFTRPDAISEFLEQRFPSPFKPRFEDRPEPHGEFGIAVSRLHSVGERHVRIWCAHRDVRDSVRDIPGDEFLAQFQKRPELPMEDVMTTLGGILRRGERSIERTRGGRPR